MSVNNIILEGLSFQAGFITPVEFIPIVDDDGVVWENYLDDTNVFRARISGSSSARNNYTIKDEDGAPWKFTMNIDGTQRPGEKINTPPSGGKTFLAMINTAGEYIMVSVDTTGIHRFYEL